MKKTSMAGLQYRTKQQTADDDLMGDVEDCGNEGNEMLPATQSTADPKPTVEDQKSSHVTSLAIYKNGVGSNKRVFETTTKTAGAHNIFCSTQCHVYIKKVLLVHNNVMVNVE